MVAYIRYYFIKLQQKHMVAYIR